MSVRADEQIPVNGRRHEDALPEFRRAHKDRPRRQFALAPVENIIFALARSDFEALAPDQLLHRVRVKPRRVDDKTGVQRRSVGERQAEKAARFAQSAVFDASQRRAVFVEFFDFNDFGVQTEFAAVDYAAFGQRGRHLVSADDPAGRSEQRAANRVVQIRFQATNRFRVDDFEPLDAVFRSVFE